MEHTTLNVNGASFHLVQTGEGPPILFLHGWPEFWLTWEPVMVRLAGRHRVIAPDLRGFGDSAKSDGGYDKKTMAQDVHALAGIAWASAPCGRGP